MELRKESPQFILELLDETGLGSLPAVMTFRQIEFAHPPVTLTAVELIELTNLLTNWNENGEQQAQTVTPRFICDLCPPAEGDEVFLTVLTFRRTQYCQQDSPVILTPTETGELRKLLQEWRLALFDRQGPDAAAQYEIVDLSEQLLMGII